MKGSASALRPAGQVKGDKVPDMLALIDSALEQTEVSQQLLDGLS